MAVKGDKRGGNEDKDQANTTLQYIQTCIGRRAVVDSNAQCMIRTSTFYTHTVYDTNSSLYKQPPTF